MDKVNLTPELLRELQLKQLDMLVYFKEFCEKNHLTFYLIGGGLIGALREGGFVPWDDDVDVMLLREDYEKLPKLWKEQHADGRFRLLKTDDEVFTGNIFITVTDTNYTMVKTNQVDIDIPHGLVLDVFPLDVAPDGHPQLRQQGAAGDLPRREDTPQDLAFLRAQNDKIQAQREQMRDGAVLGTLLDEVRVPQAYLRGRCARHL